MTTTDAPDVVLRYLDAADRDDIDSLTTCFVPDGTVTDEGHTYRGRDEIRAWRETVAGRYTYTTTVTGSELVDARNHRVSVRIAGNFPGGVADLVYRFELADGVIARLTIGG